MAKVLITGGAGFIGAHTAVKLAKRGDEIVIVDDFNNRYDPELKRSRVMHLLGDLNIPVFETDIRNLAELEIIFAEHKPDIVLHFAAWASVQPSLENPHIYSEVNIDGTVNILELVRKHDVKHLVFASSSSVYGGLDTVPFRENADITSPVSPYAATKAAGEILCATWHNLYDIPITALRFFTVYGPWGRPEMAIFKFTEALLNNQTIHMRGKDTQRDFTYIDDCVDGIIKAADNPKGFEIYNLGESDPVPLPRFITALEDAFAKKAKVQEVPLPIGDVPRTHADISKAKAAFGYHPQTNIEEGVKKFAEWYKKHYEQSQAQN